MNPERRRQVERISKQARELEPAERASFLTRACTGDELLRREVESQLTAQSELKRLLEIPTVKLVGPVTAPETARAGECDLVGHSLLHYRITGKLGSGGMGVVYRAEDTHLHRSVALKLLPEMFARDEERLRRFEREARLLATLNHSNVASIYGLEEVDDRRFLILELVEGNSLEERLKEGPIPVEEAVAIGRQIAEGLDAAHTRGIIHRDLKPANLQLNGEGRVKILDFGLAKALRDESETLDLASGRAETMTRSGMILGTVGYMSPEQALGEAVDRRADIWAFGCVLYECLTGQRAFQGKSLTEALAAILHGEPDWEALPASTPPGIVELLRRCLAKDPRARPREIADILAEFEPGRSGIAPWTRRTVRRLKIAAILLVSLILVIAAAVWLLRESGILFSPARIDSIAVLPLENLTGDPEQEYFADGMTEALITDLSKISALKVIARSSAMRYKNTEKPLAEIARELGVKALLEGSVVRESGRVRISAQLIEASTARNLWADRYERNLTGILALQGEVAQAIAHQIQVSLTREEESLLTRARDVNPEAYEAYLKGQSHWVKLTPTDLDIAFRYFETALEKDPDYAPAHVGVALVSIGRRQIGVTPPREAGPMVEDAVRKALRLDDNLAEAHYALALDKVWGQWDWQGAETAFRRTLELNPNHAEARAFYAHFQMIMLRPEAAMAEMQRALNLDPLNTLLQAMHSFVLLQSHRYDEAISVSRKVLQTVPNHPLAFTSLFMALHAKGMDKEAFEEQKKHASMRRGIEAVEVLERGYREGGFARAMMRFAEWKATRTPYLSASATAANFALAGMRELALAWLERGWQERDPDLPYLGVDPAFEALRKEPRFHDLLRRLNFPEEVLARYLDQRSN